MRQFNQIVFASNSAHKFSEFKELLKPYSPIELIPAAAVMKNADKIGTVEIYHSYAENSAAKARLVNQGCHYPALADDSGLEVEALGFKPGVHSARFVKLPGAPSQQQKDQANMAHLLSELTKAGGANRKARFICTLSLVIEGIMIQTTGTMEGSIADAPRGSNGFGYDPLFIPGGSSKTLAEMTVPEKNAISHRTHAIQDLMNQMKARGIILAKP